MKTLGAKQYLREMNIQYFDKNIIQLILTAVDELLNEILDGFEKYSKLEQENDENQHVIKILNQQYQQSILEKNAMQREIDLLNEKYKSLNIRFNDAMNQMGRDAQHRMLFK